MKTLEKNIRRLIKKQRFVLNTETVGPRRTWRRGMFDLTYRITLVGNDDYRWSPIRVNIKVKGKIEDQKSYGDTDGPSMRPVLDVVTKKMGLGWEDSWKQKSNIWGEQYNKQIRRVIRVDVENDIKNFLKLIGIGNKAIVVDKVNFEK